MTNKKILYIDMDGVIVDFDSAKNKTSTEISSIYNSFVNIPGIFLNMDPIPGAIEAVRKLSQKYDIFIASTTPWGNDSAASDKMRWVKRYFGKQFGSTFYKRVTLTHRKDLLKGDILIDDRTKNGAAEFDGEFILFGSDDFLDWDAVLRHLL